MPAVDVAACRQSALSLPRPGLQISRSLSGHLSRAHLSVAHRSTAHRSSALISHLSLRVPRRAPAHLSSSLPRAASAGTHSQRAQFSFQRALFHHHRPPPLNGRECRSDHRARQGLRDRERPSRAAPRAGGRVCIHVEAAGAGSREKETRDGGGQRGRVKVLDVEGRQVEGEEIFEVASSSCESFRVASSKVQKRVNCTRGTRVS
jgi:hypothetical protein